MDWKKLLPGLLALCLICPIASAQTPATITDTLPKWTASDAQLQLLGDAVTHPGFTIRPPIGYREMPIASGVNKEVGGIDRRGYSWHGPIHDGGAGFSGLQVQVITFTDLPKETITARDFAETGLEGFKRDYVKITVSKFEDGELNGWVCARVYWKGKLDVTRHPDAVDTFTHGFIYSCWNPQTRTALAVAGSDTDPYYSQTSKELEAAALTLKPN